MQFLQFLQLQTLAETKRWPWYWRRRVAAIHRQWQGGNGNSQKGRRTQCGNRSLHVFIHCFNHSSDCIFYVSFIATVLTKRLITDSILPAFLIFVDPYWLDYIYLTLSILFILFFVWHEANFSFSFILCPCRKLKL